jgi:ribosomal protein L40E
MIPKPALVTSLLLVVAVMAFAGLAYQTVPVGTTQTETLNSYSPYAVVNTSLWLTSTSTTTTVTYPATTACEESYFPAVCNSYPGGTARVIYIITGITVHYMYQVQETATVPYAATESSTSFMPAVAALGLTDGLFIALAVLVIGILALLTGYIILKSSTHHKPKQATLSQFVQAPTSCIKCGAPLPPASEFCNKCGTRQQA